MIIFLSFLFRVTIADKPLIRLNFSNLIFLLVIDMLVVVEMLTQQI
jgi:hypothetical protein